MSRNLRCIVGILCFLSCHVVSFTVSALPCPSLLTSLPSLTMKSAWRTLDLPWKQSSRSLSRVRNQSPSNNLITRFMSSSKETGNMVMSRRNLLQIFGAFLLGVPPLLELYSRLGLRTTETSSLPLLASPPSGASWDEVEHATLVFHGAGGQDKFTDQLMTKLQGLGRKSTFYGSMVEWSNYSSNILQASFNAQRIGTTAATQLAQKAGHLKTVHLIGISVGAFAADAACRAIKSSLGGESVFVQLTLLDPFTQRGIFDMSYGARNFGNDADYFQQYLNTDDPVPSTNAPLENSVCFDITDIRPEEISFGHDWPVAYYGQKGNVGIVPPEQRLPRGTLVKVAS